MSGDFLSLTHSLAAEVGASLCESHRADVLKEYPNVSAWARSRVDRPGLAWAFVCGKPVVAGGVESRGETGLFWLAGTEGWTRYVRHVIRIFRAILESGTYARYTCEVVESDAPSRRFAERLGFRFLGARDGLIHYGVQP